MDQPYPQYQRAVTPTMEQTAGSLSSARGKVLSYQSQKRGKAMDTPPTVPTPNNRQLSNNQRFVTRPSNPQNGNLSQNDMNVQGRSAASSRSSFSTGQAPRLNSVESSLDITSSHVSLPRCDLVPLSDEVPPDGIVFARVRNQMDSSLVVFRTNEERLRNPERLNLDRRQLDVCPTLEHEHKLRLLNYQNNNIKCIQNLENLPNLIFLDLYNNKLISLDGPVSLVKGLRVLMAGKNRISVISNLSNLKKLDVLDLHSNEIKAIEGLDCLTDLRVLNLAGNRISIVQNLSLLSSLTELNLRRNRIEHVAELNHLPQLQRIFLSHNFISSIDDISCLFDVRQLIELSLDGNPLTDKEGPAYRHKVIAHCSTLRHLDLKRITEEERNVALMSFRPVSVDEAAPGGSKGQASNGERRSEVADGDEDGGGSMEAGDGPGAPSSIQTVSAPEKVSVAELARQGNLPSSQSFFDLEIIAPSEKALVAVGDAWEWVQTRRLLVTVTEASVFHTKKETLLVKFLSGLPFLTSLRVLRLGSNELDSLQDLHLVFEAVATHCSAIQEVIIIDSSVLLSSKLARALAVVDIPTLSSFNGVNVTEQERVECVRQMQLVRCLIIGHINGSISRVSCRMDGASMQSGNGSKAALQRREREKDPVKRQSISVPRSSAEELVSNFHVGIEQNRRVRDIFDKVLATTTQQIIRETIEALKDN